MSTGTPARGDQSFQFACGGRAQLQDWWHGIPVNLSEAEVTVHERTFGAFRRHFQDSGLPTHSGIRPARHRPWSLLTPRVRFTPQRKRRTVARTDAEPLSEQSGSPGESVHPVGGNAVSVGKMHAPESAADQTPPSADTRPTMNSPWTSPTLTAACGIVQGERSALKFSPILSNFDSPDKLGVSHVSA